MVASNGFSFKSKDETDLKILKISDLKEDDKNRIENYIKKEILGGLPKGIELQFIHSDLPSKSDELTVKGKISNVIATLFPKSKYNVEDIYRMLIDELFRKGENRFDYKEWNDLLENKALTSNKVIAAIENSTSIINDDIENEFKVGGKLYDYGFASSSTKKSVGEEYSDNGIKFANCSEVTPW